MPLCSVEEAVAELRQGKMIILVDDEDRENEGDLTMAAEFATPEAINFMAKFGRGLICLPLAPELADNLNLPLMTQRNGSRFGTNFTVSIEAREGITTGISAADRAHTIVKHNLFQTGAVSEGVRTDRLHTARDRNIGQSGTARKSRAEDIRHSASDRDRGQAGAV